MGKKDKKIFKSDNEKIQHAEYEFSCNETKAVGSTGDVDIEKFFYFDGYGSTYGNQDSYDDIMVEGCFDESIKTIKPSLLWMHKMSEPVGIYTEVKSDSKGLFLIGKMPRKDTLVDGRIIPQIEIGSVRAMSIGYIVQEWYYDEEKNIRYITKCRLIEVSLVGFPANDQAQMTSFKSLNIDDLKKEIKTKREFEKLLKDSGLFSQKSAAYLASMIRDEFDDANGDVDGSADNVIENKSITEVEDITKEMNELISSLR